MQHLYSLSARLWTQAPAAHPQWPDPDQPGAMGEPAQGPAPAPAAAAAEAAEAPGRGQPLRARPRSRSVPPPAPRSARYEAAAAPLQLGRPRPSLCARTAKWLRAGAGLLTCALLYSASRQLSSREVSKSSAGPISSEGMNSSGRDAPADLLCAPLHPLTPFTGTTRLETTVRLLEPDAALAPQTLTEAIEAILVGPDPVLNLWTLATQLPKTSPRRLPMAALDRMVDAYRASRLWREPDAMAKFLVAMFDTPGKASIRDAHIEHLLRIWSWRYGELHDADGKQIAAQKEVGPHCMVMPMMNWLGGSSLSDERLRLLIGTLSKEPENIRPGGLLSPQEVDPVLSEHAARVAAALVDLIARLQPQPDKISTADVLIDPAQLLRCVRMLIQQPAADPRWLPLVLAQLEAWSPEIDHRPLIAAPQWKRLILETVQAHLAATAPDLRPARTFGDAIMALGNPERYRLGYAFGIQFLPL